MVTKLRDWSEEKLRKAQVHLRKACNFAAFIVVAGVLAGCGHRFETQYANNRVRDKCGKIMTGDSVESVFRELGQPLFIEINRDRAGYGGWDKERRYDVDLLLVQEFTQQTNVVIYLHYSSPTARATGYSRYQVDVSGGRVIDVSAGVLVD
jgi:hypothetical protein